MSLPGTSVVERQSPPARSAPIEAGTWFITGMSERGPVNIPVLIRNLQQFTRVFGDRVSYGTLYDAVDVFFKEGGSRVYVSRVAGPSPTTASATLSDGTNSTATITAKWPGVWGDDIDIVTTVPSSGLIKIDVKYKTVVVESSPAVADVAALVAWSESSDYIDVVDLGHNDPVAANSALSGGDDDHGDATDTQWANALAAFTKDLGPGQVSAPGRTTATAHSQLLSHGSDHNRVALLDLADTATVATLTGAAATDRALDTSSYGGAFAPWAVVPGIAPGTTRTVPYTAIEAGMIARNDADGKSPNIAAAGINGVSRYAVGLSQSAWSDADRETLNDAGVNVALIKNGSVATYGYRTLVDGLDDDKWLQLSNRRLYMVIAARADLIAENYMFAEIDGKGLVFSRLAGELTAMLMDYFPGSLYGESFAEAAFVDAGIAVNTPETIAALEINAEIEIRMSPFGETVTIGISKTRTTEVI